VREPSPYFIQRRPPLEPAIEAEFAPSFFEDEATKIDLWVYWRLVRKRLRLIAAVVAGTTFITLIHLLNTTPIYTAQTTMMILPKAPSGIDPAAALLEIEASYDRSDYFKTQSEILKSKTLAASVVRNLGLNRNPAFNVSERPGLFSSMLGGLRQRLHDLLTPPPGANANAPPMTAHSIAGADALGSARTCAERSTASVRRFSNTMDAAPNPSMKSRSPG